jgi:hypothetical protein
LAASAEVVDGDKPLVDEDDGCGIAPNDVLPIEPPAWNGEPSAERIAATVVCVAAPVGSGKDAALTGCVACQNVPVTQIDLDNLL